MTPVDIKYHLELLTGQQAPLGDTTLSLVPDILVSEEHSLGYSQLNELLLLFGFDRVTHSFFRFLIDGTIDYAAGDALQSAEQLHEGIRRFREMALLAYGNVKFAFKTLSREVEPLRAIIREREVIPEERFHARHESVLPLIAIPAEDTYLTGYLVAAELQARLKDESDEEAKALERRRQDVVATAEQNHHAYLASDHLDVYVATSMRERHEFASVNRLAGEIFGHPLLRSLKLRWFDPTQAYCKDRVDKGLSEALMLRRASCTIYLAQESDTLGKDSELASTLAQGKPVVSFIPRVDDEQFGRMLEDLEKTRSDDLPAALLEQLQIFSPRDAWTDREVMNWCAGPGSIDQKRLRQRLRDSMEAHYDRRARTLRDSHPLGIQVNLETGVATGVLVVRTVSECAELVRRILTQTVQFDLEDNDNYTLLREKISQSIFRVMTRDTMLTNTFWNFYRNPAE